jgi:hypothetical protein
MAARSLGRALPRQSLPGIGKPHPAPLDLRRRRGKATMSFGINAGNAMHATSLNSIKRLCSTMPEQQFRAKSSIGNLFVALSNIAKGS